MILALTVAQGLLVGIWAEFFPRSFYDSFPGFGLHWVSMMGAWDEHLVSDVGSFYLGLSALTIVAIFARTDGPGRLAGIGWTVFGVFHFVYHLTHPMGSTFDRVGNLASLGVAALLGIVLLFPGRTVAATKEQRV
ncbi:hypothetical protein [Curtobacterium sp. PhB136]|uniref:hypothetical protein n=1 Tax=Curtobacterium sp. PhB136 TaxID=2485181 RepID=UPI001FB5741F|nr:hypothetical protein [Curtobacterium sp. PhB136]